MLKQMGFALLTAVLVVVGCSRAPAQAVVDDAPKPSVDRYVGNTKDTTTVTLWVDVQPYRDGGWVMFTEVANSAQGPLQFISTCEGLVSLAGWERHGECQPAPPLRLEPGQRHQEELIIPTGELGDPTEAWADYVDVSGKSYRITARLKRVGSSSSAPAQPMEPLPEFVFHQVDLSGVDQVVITLHPKARVYPPLPGAPGEIVWTGEQAMHLADLLTRAPHWEPRRESQPSPAVEPPTPTLLLALSREGHEVATAEIGSYTVMVTGENAYRSKTDQLRAFEEKLLPALTGRRPASYWNQHEAAMKDTALAFVKALVAYDVEGMQKHVRADLRGEVATKFDWRHITFFDEPRAADQISVGANDHPNVLIALRAEDSQTKSAIQWVVAVMVHEDGVWRVSAFGAVP